MDEFRAPSRPGQLGRSPYDVPVRARVTQTPNQITAAPAAVAPQPAIAANPLVNPSLLGGFAPQPAPVTIPVQPPVQSMPTTPRQDFDFAPPKSTPDVHDLFAKLASSQVAPSLATPAPLGQDFSVPRPQAITHEAAQTDEPIAVPSPAPESAETAQAAAPSPFDIATIQEADKPKNRLLGRRRLRKWAFGSGIVGLILVLGTGGLLFAQTYNNSHKVFRGTSGNGASLASANTTKLKGESDGRVNILLLGNGGLGHEAPDLTDTIIVASIDTVNKTTTMLSVPRDLYVQVPGGGSSKINAAYETGKYNAAGKIDNTNDNTKAVMAGFSTIDQTIENVLGIKIQYNALVNFTSFKQAVDAVGGVSVNVPEALYDPTMAWENNNNPILAPAGVQTMDGKKALMYVRSRETSSDFARSQRQRNVILALKNKVLTAGTLSNPLKLSGLVNAFGDNMVTDMSLAEGMRAYDLTKSIDNSKVQTVDLVTPPNNLVTTSTISGASVVLPRAGQSSYADIQAYVKQLFNPPKAVATATTTAGATAAPATTTAPETATISVLNGTSKAGYAGTQAAVIRTAGYNVVQTGNAAAVAKTIVVDLSNGANPKTKKYLESLYGATAVTQLPAGISAGTANFVVILGTN